MSECLHEGIKTLGIAVRGGELHQPFGKNGVEGLALGLGDDAGFLNEILVGAEGVMTVPLLPRP
jgi:hypothetical protein